MGKYKTGRLPATRPAGLAELEVYATGKIPTPPPTVAVPDAAYPIDNNQNEGDCTIAGEDHLQRAWNELYPAHAVALPTEPEIKTEYRALTGGGDTGLNEAFVLKTWQTKGLFGAKIEGYAPVNPKDTLGLHQSIAFYDGAYLGILCPESAQRQFAEEKETGRLVPWTYEGEEAEDGHCIVALGYTKTGVLCATWGGIVEVTYGFFAHYLEEVWAVISSQAKAHKGDRLGLDLAALQADLPRV